MRRLLLLVALLVSAHLVVSAQRPWVEYDVRQQERLLASPKTSEQVRKSMEHLESLTIRERETLWDIVTEQRVKGQLSSLYLYIYEMLRTMDGRDSRGDVAMLRFYAPYFLKRWASQDGATELYNYGYALGREMALGSRHSVVMALAKCDKRRYKRLYGNVINTLYLASSIAERSLLLSESLDEDYTSFERLAIAPREVSAEEFLKVKGSVEPIRFESGFVSEDEQHVAAEVRMWSGVYCRRVDSPLGERVSVVEVLGNQGREVVVVDAHKECVVLPEKIYVTPRGEIFALSFSGEGLAGVVLGAVERGSVRIVGEVPIEGLLLQAVKCSDHGLWLFGECEGEVRGLFIESGVL